MAGPSSIMSLASMGMPLPTPPSGGVPSPTSLSWGDVLPPHYHDWDEAVVHATMSWGEHDSNIFITDFLLDQEIIEYYNQIVLIVTIIRTKLQEYKSFEKPKFDECFACIFGGFVRDIIAGVPLEELKMKDIDVAIRNSYKLSHAAFVEVSTFLMIELESVFPDMKYESTPMLECSHLEQYTMHRMWIGGIQFDLLFDIAWKEDRFKMLYDYTCNSLYVNISDGRLKNRCPNLTVEASIKDIQSHSLRDMSEYTQKEYKPSYSYEQGAFKEYKEKMKLRKQKMFKYGYTEVPDWKSDLVQGGYPVIN